MRLLELESLPNNVFYSEIGEFGENIAATMNNGLISTANEI